ncbi:MAG TPA: O-methyltransferase [Alphaproteobacteria bacterium]|nr:O-methyltransferase [Alphaproteobacteria bacterium]
MSEKLWSEVDAYIARTLLAGADPVFADVLGANAAGGLPAIDVSPAQGRFLELLVRITGARRVLEIGTLGGYSTIWMARALPADGRLVTLEFSPWHAEVARANVERAGVAGQVDLRVGPALESLPKVEREGVGPFDLIFIDADKPNNPNYVDWAVKLARPGTVIVLDNVVRDGAVIEEGSGDASVEGARRGLELMGRHPRLRATALQTVGAKGYDGFAIAVVD